VIEMSKENTGKPPASIVALAWVIQLVCGSLSLAISIWHASMAKTASGQQVALTIALLGGATPASVAALLSPMIHAKGIGTKKKWMIRLVFVGAMAMSFNALHDAVEPIFGTWLAWVFPATLDITTMIALDTIMEGSESPKTPSVAAPSAPPSMTASAPPPTAPLGTPSRAPLSPPLRGGSEAPPEGAVRPPREGVREGAAKAVSGGGAKAPSRRSDTAPSKASSNGGPRKLSVEEIVDDIVARSHTDFADRRPGTDKIRAVYGGGYKTHVQVRDELAERYPDGTPWPPPALKSIKAG
jgi:hypothetical protein